MKRITTRKVLSVLVGVACGTLTSVLVDRGLWKLLIYASGIDETKTPTFFIAVPLWSQVVWSLLQPLAALVGCAVATFAAKSTDKSPTIATMVILMLLYATNEHRQPQPKWLLLIALLGFLFAALAGFSLGKKVESRRRSKNASS